MIDWRQSRHGCPAHADQAHRLVAEAVFPQKYATNRRKRDPPREPGHHAQSRESERLGQHFREKSIIGAEIPDADRDAESGCQAAARQPSRAATKRGRLSELVGKMPGPGRKPSYVTALVRQKRPITAMRIDK